MKTYTVRRIAGKPEWRDIPVAQVDCHLWLPSEQIQMTAQVCYDDQALYVRMCATEPNVRAENTGPLSMVHEDSCMEIFFCPNVEDDRYINFEINPNCATNIGVGSCRADRVRVLPKNEDTLFQKQACRTKDGWEVSFRIPVSFLRSLFPGYVLEPGMVIRANIYKCGDLTVSPHFLSWNPVDNPTPDFHRSCDFGVLLLG